MKEIKLTQGKVALVDDADFEILSKHKWYAHNKNGWYAVRTVYGENGKTTKELMHRLLINVPKGLQTDHIDGDGLNNQRKNLRICTNSQNQKNKTAYKTNTSGFKGVCWKKAMNKWAAKITSDNKTIHLGYFSDKVEAANAYNVASKIYHREFSRLT